LKSRKLTIAAIAIVAFIFLVVSILSVLPYLNLKYLQIDQVLYSDVIEFSATNPTILPVIFPETELNVTVDTVYYGRLGLKQTEIPPNKTVMINSKFELDQEGFEILKNTNSITNPGMVKYEGIAKIRFLFIENIIPIEFEKSLDQQKIVMG
jgi:hypothetical protein